MLASWLLRLTRHHDLPHLPKESGTLKVPHWLHQGVRHDGRNIAARKAGKRNSSITEKKKKKKKKKKREKKKKNFFSVPLCFDRNLPELLRFDIMANSLQLNMKQCFPFLQARQAHIHSLLEPSHKRRVNLPRTVRRRKQEVAGASLSFHSFNLTKELCFHSSNVLFQLIN